MIKSIFKLSQKYSKNLKTRFYFSTKKHFQTKLQDRQYLQILGITQKDIYNINQSILHRAYINQIKKYHSDSVFNEESKRQYQEIAKCIIIAYEQARKQITNSNQNQDSEQFIKDQDQASQILFGKKFNDMKYELYKPGNQQMKDKFIKYLDQYRQLNKKSTDANTGYKSQKEERSQSRSHYQSPSQKSNSGKIAAGIAIFSLLMIPFLTRTQKKSTGNPNEPPKQHKIIQYTQKELDIIVQNSNKVTAKSLQLFLNDLLKNRPHMLNYPNKQDPGIIQQLAYFSIASDIHLYEVQSKYFLDKEEFHKLQKQNSAQHIKKYRLTQTKPNSLLTLSLQAQRVLQNVYISVDDIVQEIQKTGKYTPPKIFFNFYGYIMVEIRDKPFSNLLNYRNKRYISLFELYFDYYSPIYFKRDYYNQYLVGLIEDSPVKNYRYFGHVNINKKSIPTKYLDNKQKVIIMKDISKLISPGGYLIQQQSKNRQLWENYYINYEKLWKKSCPHQASGDIKY